MAEAVADTSAKTSPIPANNSEKPKFKGTGLKGLGDLSALQKAVEKRKQEQPQKEQDEEPKSYEINPSINLPLEQFQTILTSFVDQLKAAGKMNFASALEHGETRIEHNCWHYKVGNQLSLQMIEKEKNLLPYLRKQSGIKDLFLKLVVDDNLKRPEESIPYSPEDKLKVMGEKNPTLNKLQEIFNTRIIY